MRFVRPALLAVALAATVSTAPAHAALGDGAENAGVGCQARLTEVSSGSYAGVLLGGPWVAANLVRNNNGALSVESDPGVPEDLQMSCWVKETYGGAVYGKQAGTTVGPVMYYEPRALAFDTSYNTFEVCTEVRWDLPSYPGYHADVNCAPVVVT